MPENAKRLVPGSSWGTFTIACTIPIALFIGWYMYHFRKGKIIEASILGAIAVLAATVGGGFVPGSPLEPLFLPVARRHRLRAGRLTASSRPSCRSGSCSAPRDYLSTFLKIGTILLLVAGRDRRQPQASGAPGQPLLRVRAAGPTLTGQSSPMSSSASCAARSRAFTPWSHRARRPR